MVRFEDSCFGWKDVAAMVDQFNSVDSRSRVVRRVFLMVALAGALAFATSCSSKMSAAPAMPPPHVSVVAASAQDVPKQREWVATLDGYVNAQIQPQVSGYLIKQNFREGSLVRKGEVLFEIDPRPFQAALNQAGAQLEQAKARLALAEVNVRRDTPLAQQRAIAQSQLDSELAALQEAKANVQAAQAAVETVRLNLSFAKVRSLIDGIAGTATVQMGNLVGPTSVLTTVSKLDPIKVYFPISEQEYMAYTKASRNVSGAKSMGDMSLELVLSDGSTFGQKGKVAFTDRQVDPQTGTIRMVGSFSNPGNLLRPGQFARVRAITGVMKSAVLIPQRAVSEIQGDYMVAVVGNDNKVATRKVKVGERIGQMWVIEDGVVAGERVITEGGMKVRDGMPVNATVEMAKVEQQQ
jgi:RND family efflux transporter MFP subunit